jgi:hypothetical protein
MRLDQNVDYVAVLIHGTPQILLLAVDSNKDLVQVPVVAEPALSSLQFPSIVRTEFLTPLSDRFIRHNDSALGEKILDISEAQAEAMVNPDRIADNLGRETVARVTRRIAFHDTSFSGLVPELTMPIGPFPSNANMRFVHPPGAIRHPKLPATASFQFWSVPLDPAPNRNVIHAEIAFSHELFNISIAE